VTTAVSQTLASATPTTAGPGDTASPTSPSPLVRGTTVVYRNGSHMTAHFSSTLWSKLEAAILRVRSQPGVVIGP